MEDWVLAMLLFSAGQAAKQQNNHSLSHLSFHGGKEGKRRKDSWAETEIDLIKQLKKGW